MVDALRDARTQKEAKRALRKVSSRATGALIDAFMREDTPYETLPTLASVLAFGSAELAARGMLLALRSSRFPVRYWASQVLARIRLSETINLDANEICRAVQYELGLDSTQWTAPTQLIRPQDDHSPFLDERTRQNIHARLEYVFALLALTEDAGPLHWALRALHSTQEPLRGFALEYLETRLPPAIWASLRPFVSGKNDLTGRTLLLDPNEAPNASS